MTIGAGNPEAAATRMELLKTRRRIEQVRRAADLLERKREALIGELLGLARPALDARSAIDERAAVAYRLLLAALGANGAAELRTLSWPTRYLELELRGGSVWGVPVAEIVDRDPAVREPAPRGIPAHAGLPTALAAENFEVLIDLLLDAAPREMVIRRLGLALARTTRQVNTLRLRVSPQLARREAGIRAALEEREREERLRLKHLLSHRSRKRPGFRQGAR